MSLRFIASAARFCSSRAATRLVSCATAAWYALLVRVANRFRHFLDLGFELSLSVPNRCRGLDHFRVALAERLGQLGTLPLEIGELGLQLLDEGVREHGRERVE
jgi:hypothetical protein